MYIAVLVNVLQLDAAVQERPWITGVLVLLVLFKDLQGRSFALRRCCSGSKKLECYEWFLLFLPRNSGPECILS